MSVTSHVHIKVEKVAERTILKSAFFTSPFKVLDITEDKKSPGLNLMLMSTSPGILDGDDINMHIHLAPHSLLALYTQGYQRIFEMEIGARQNLLVNMAEHSSFYYLPHPTVPHQRSILQVENIFQIHATARFVYGEVITCGRKHSGESFLFSKFQSVTRVYIENKLMIKENLLLQPGIEKFNQLGMLEGYSHQASLLLIGPHTPGCDNIISILSLEKNTASGITEIFPGGRIVRILGYGAEQLYHCIKIIANTFSDISC